MLNNIYKAYGYFLYRDQKFLRAYLKGGLCNKLFCLFSAFEIALQDKIQILEPEFGWKEKILFSDIYDLKFLNDYFRNKMDGNDLIVSQKRTMFIRHKNIIQKDNLWSHSEGMLDKQRTNALLKHDDIMVQGIKALKLNNENNNFIEPFLNKHFDAVQIRIEADWVQHSKINETETDENILIDPNLLISLLVENNLAKNIFFTTGENHSKIADIFKDHQLSSSFFFNENLEYEVNAAINFEICCLANNFSGLSRSTYSNLISLRRSLNKKESYIYNYKNILLLRKDCGLYANPRDAVHTKIRFI